MKSIVIFLYNAFDGPLIEQLLGNIEASLLQSPRTLYIVYYNPVFAGILDASPALERRYAAQIPYDPGELGYGPDASDTVVIWQNRETRTRSPRDGPTPRSLSSRPVGAGLPMALAPSSARSDAAWSTIKNHACRFPARYGMVARQIALYCSKALIGKETLPMEETSTVRFSGVFALRDGVREEEFLPRLHAFLQHFIDMGFAKDYRVMRREALDGFGKTLPAFTYRGELIYPDLEREHAAYEYVKQRGEQVHSLHVAMNSLVKSNADFFLETQIA